MDMGWQTMAKYSDSINVVHLKNLKLIRTHRTTQCRNKSKLFRTGKQAEGRPPNTEWPSPETEYAPPVLSEARPRVKKV